MALTLGQLATATGYGYSTIQKWHKMGLPLLDGRITLNDAMTWRKAHEVAKPKPCRTEVSISSHYLLKGSPETAVLRPRGERAKQRKSLG